VEEFDNSTVNRQTLPKCGNEGVNLYRLRSVTYIMIDDDGDTVQVKTWSTLSILRYTV